LGPLKGAADARFPSVKSSWQTHRTAFVFIHNLSHLGESTYSRATYLVMYSSYQLAIQFIL
jgi:hypothetical protein